MYIIYCVGIDYYAHLAENIDDLQDWENYISLRTDTVDNFVSDIMTLPHKDLVDYINFSEYLSFAVDKH